MKMILTDYHLFPYDQIAEIDYSRIEDLIVTGKLKSGTEFRATNLHAIELVMSIKPSAFEGKRLRWHKFMWIIHNVIGHPLMQLLWLVRARKLAIWIHDSTVPRPVGKR